MPSFAAPHCGVQGETELLQGLRGGREPGSACGVLAAHGDPGQGAKQGQQPGLARQGNGEVSSVHLSASPGCSKQPFPSNGGLPSRCHGDGYRGGRARGFLKGVERGKEE